MSTFLGFNWLRSSPSLSLAGAARQARLTCANKTSSSSPPAALFNQTLFHSGRWLLSCSQHGPKNIKHRRQWPSSTSHFLVQRRTFFGSKSTVLTHYVHLPPTYKDEEGLPFHPKNDHLTFEEARTIFAGFPDMSPDRATKLLKILHGRRVAGTLDDPSLRNNTASYKKREIDRALVYLRTEIPVDEVLNAGLRAEDELRELESSLSDTSVEASKESAGAPAKDDKDDPRSVYGEGVLDKIRARNIALREAEERAEAERRKREEETAAQNWGALTEAPYDPGLHRGLHPAQLEHYEAATSNLEAPPEVPRWRVLWPATAFTAAVVAALYFLIEPRPVPDGEQGEILQCLSPSRAVMYGLAAVNVAVFIAWRRVRLWKYLNKHFILDFVAPRPYQLLTALTTHQQSNHLLKTLFCGLVGAALLVDEIGPSGFLATYAASGMCGYLATLWTHVVRGNAAIYMFGASSASLGAICAYFWLYRFDGFKILGLPPDPYQGIQGLGIVGLLMAFFALVPMVRRQGGNTDWMSHLVGMLTGVGCAAVLEGRWKAAKKERMLHEVDVGEKPVQQVVEEQKK